MHANTRLRPCVSSYMHIALVYLSAWVCVTAMCTCDREGVPLGLSAPRSESAKRLVTWSIHYIRTIASSNRHAPSLWIWRAHLVCACVVLFCVFQRVSRETSGAHTRSTILPKSAKFSAVRGNHQGRRWWPWESSAVCDLSFRQFAIVLVRFKWHDFCIGHATPVIYVMRTGAKQLIRFLFEISDLRTYEIHIIAAYYCALPKHLFA